MKTWTKRIRENIRNPLKINSLRGEFVSEQCNRAFNRGGRGNAKKAIAMFDSKLADVIRLLGHSYGDYEPLSARWAEAMEERDADERR